MSPRATRAVLFLTALLFGVVATVTLTVAASAIFGHKVVANESSVMEPTLSDGDLVVARQLPPDEIDPGELMTFSEPETGELITRRVRAIVETGDEVVFEAKGDASTRVERFSLPIEGQVAQPRRKIPLVGYVAALPFGLLLLALIPTVGLTIVAGVELSRRLRRQPRP